MWSHHHHTGSCKKLKKEREKACCVNDACCVEYAVFAEISSQETKKCEFSQTTSIDK